MGARSLSEEIVTVEELIKSKRFDSLQEIYKIPDSVLPRVRRNGKIVRPLRFYVSDVEKLFAMPAPKQAPPSTGEQHAFVKPSINFKKRRK